MIKPAIVALIMALLVLPLCAATDVEKKTSAMNKGVRAIIDIQEQPMYDNFIASDGNEYVIVIIDGTSSFLFQLVPIEGGYEAQAIYDNNSIEQIVSSRYATTKNATQSLEESKEQIHQLVGEFNSSRFFYEAKYDAIVGMPAKGCNSTDECRQVCIGSPVCKYAYEKSGESLIEQIMAYQKQKDEVGGLVKMEGELYLQKSNKSELETLSTYSDVLDKLAEAAQKLQQNSIQDQDNLLYAGSISYNLMPVVNAKGIVSSSLTPARAADERAKALLSIKEITALHMPAKPAENETKTEAVEVVPQQPENEAANDTNVSKTTNLISAKYIDEPKEQEQFDMIVFAVALLIIIGTVIVAAMAIKAHFEKGKNGLGKKKEANIRDFVSGFGKKEEKRREIYSLEDLVEPKK